MYGRRLGGQGLYGWEEIRRVRLICVGKDLEGEVYMGGGRLGGRGLYGWGEIRRVRLIWVGRD